MAIHAVHPFHMPEHAFAHAAARLRHRYDLIAIRVLRTWDRPRRERLDDPRPPRQQVDAATMRQRASYQAGGMRSFTTF